MPKVVDHASRRREIVYALWAVIHREGIAAASLRAVADEADVSIGRIQHYFASKDELVREGCREMIAIAAAEHVGAGAGAGDPREALLQLASHAIPGSETARVAVSVWYAYVARVDADPAIREMVCDALKGGEDEMARLIASARGREVAGNADRADGRRLVSLGEGLAGRVLARVMTPDAAVALLTAEVNALLAR